MLFSVAGFVLLASCANNLLDNDDSDDSTVSSADFAYTVTDALDANDNDHGDSEDYEWYSTDVISITLNGTSITESTSGATALNPTMRTMRPGVMSTSKMAH